MYLPLSEVMKFSDEHKLTLKNLVIDENAPGTVLRDFDSLLNLTKAGKMLLTPTYQLSMTLLSEINTHLAHPLQLNLKRPQQKSNPYIQGLYLLLRASGLTYVGGTPKKPLLCVDEEVYQAWTRLNPVERYGTLLETWLLRGKPEAIGEYARPFDTIPQHFLEAARFYVQLHDVGLPITGDRNTEASIQYGLGWYNLALLELFGLVRIQHGKPEPGQGWHVERVYPTPLGDALIAVLFSEFFKDLRNIFTLEDAGEIPFGSLQKILQPYWPDWKTTLALPQWAFREGLYIFKVSLGKVWSLIAIDAHEPLDQLASLILDSVKFDSDHLYRFSYRNRFGYEQRVNHSYLDEGPYTSEVQIGDLPLLLGQQMTYLFDFGDNWKFNVVLEQIETGKFTKKPGVLETHGKPPEQYPNWEGDDYDDEEEEDLEP